ncbi:hypothetical protein [Dechloromonas sp. H13]|uniref:hypothetical protein n=1 Tax=Dechloromonas sp. H13 TaxID=2570193 RepID=UPI001290B229|nr:hypothetical protein [Dechloromonas sp. H13]
MPINNDDRFSSFKEAFESCNKQSKNSFPPGIWPNSDHWFVSRATTYMAEQPLGKIVTKISQDELTNLEFFWFGVSSEKGWVVLDRRLGVNEPAGHSDLLFIELGTWRAFRDTRARWDEPNYHFAKKFIADVSDAAEREKLEAELEVLKQKLAVDGYETAFESVKSVLAEIGPRAYGYSKMAAFSFRSVTNVLSAEEKAREPYAFYNPETDETEYFPGER